VGEGAYPMMQGRRGKGGKGGLPAITSALDSFFLIDGGKRGKKKGREKDRRAGSASPLRCATPRSRKTQSNQALRLHRTAAEEGGKEPKRIENFVKKEKRKKTPSPYLQPSFFSRKIERRGKRKKENRAGAAPGEKNGKGGGGGSGSAGVPFAELQRKKGRGENRPCLVAGARITAPTEEKRRDQRTATSSRHQHYDFMDNSGEGKKGGRREKELARLYHVGRMSLTEGGGGGPWVTSLRLRPLGEGGGKKKKK